jgi:NAD(P)-dependent dehydrogenase (short-subunit alcohol dehydrogenase family)
MGTAVARLLGAGRLLVLADIDAVSLEESAEALRVDGYSVKTAPTDVTSPESVAALAETAASLGRLTGLVHTAGLSPEQASVETILAVDLLGVAIALDEFGKVMQSGGAGVVISSMAGHLNSPIDAQVELQLATSPTHELVTIASCAAERFGSPQEAYGYAKRANQLRVAAAASVWGARGARVNSVSPGVISTAMGRQELDGNSGGLMRVMVEGSPARRLGTAQDIAAAVDFLLSPAASFITGTDLLVDGGVTAAARTGAIDFAAALRDADLSV